MKASLQIKLQWDREKSDSHHQTCNSAVSDYLVYLTHVLLVEQRVGNWELPKLASQEYITEL